MIRHIFPCDGDGSGIVAYGTRIDQIMGSEFERWPDVSHFEIGTCEVAQLWQAHRLLKSGKPYVLTIHDPPLVVLKPFSRWLTGPAPVKALRKALDLTLGRLVIRQVVRGARAIIVLNARAKPIMARQFNVPLDRIKASALPLLLPDVPVPDVSGAPQILFLGHIVPHKGLDLLLEAFDRIAAAHDGVRLTLAGISGDPRYLRTLTQRVAASAWSDRLSFAGYLDDEALAACVAACDIVVLPYRDTGIVHASGPLVIAMHYGKAIVASDIPVFRDALEGGRGLLFREGDSADLAEKLASAIGSSSLRVQLGAGARQHMAEHHADDVIRGQLNSIYAQL